MPRPGRRFATDCEALAAARWTASRCGPGGANPLQDEWAAITNHLRDPATLGGPWEFWLRWYQDALDGRPPDWPLLEKIALIDDETWTAGPEAVNAEIEQIRRTHRTDAGRDPKELLLAERLMQAALSDFRFDTARRLMRMEPARQTSGSCRTRKRLREIWTTPQSFVTTSSG